MNKKGDAFWNILWIIIVLIIFIALIIVLLVVGTKYTNKSEIPLETPLKIYLQSQDIDNETQLSGEYFIKSEDNSYLVRGKLQKDSLVEIKNVPNRPLTVYCWTEGYYSNFTKKIFTATEISQNTSKITCYQGKISQIEISRTGGINDIDNIITLNISTPKHYNRLSTVFTWTSGIIDATTDTPKKQCDTWTNYSYYDNETKNYFYLPQDYYICDNQIEICAYVKDGLCTLKSNIPLRFEDIADYTISTGINLDKNYYEMILHVKTREIKNKNDYLQIIFYDQDLRPVGNDLIFHDDVGEKDFVYKINYEEI